MKDNSEQEGMFVSIVWEWQWVRIFRKNEADWTASQDQLQVLELCTLSDTLCDMNISVHQAR